MGHAHPSAHRHERSTNLPPLRRDGEAALIEENAQLRELVIYLSKLVIKNVVDRK
jgi:hypothetical protein